MSTTINRRRFITISAAAGTLAFGGQAVQASTKAAPYRWQGTALGARASMLLHHTDHDQAAKIVSSCVAEIERLENIFSLYRDRSAIVHLNKTGFVDPAPLEMIQALADCRRLSEITDGAFDVTVQPLWQLFARHFSKPDADPAGPAAAEITAARKLVNYRRISIDPARISLDAPGMAITLNGFAQGFVTDRIADLLRREGLKNVLVDMGETRALDDHPEGRPWKVGIRDPQNAEGVVRTLPLADMAVATSGGYGQTFSTHSPHHHLFDPRTGSPSQLYASVTVTAPRAATADALSTALSSLPVTAARSCLQKSGATSAHFLHHDGSFTDVNV